MTNTEISDIENIVRNLKKARNLSSNKKESEITDLIQNSIDYAQYLLPKGNRHKT